MAALGRLDRRGRIYWFTTIDQVSDRRRPHALDALLRVFVRVAVGNKKSKTGRSTEISESTRPPLFQDRSMPLM